VVWQGSAGNRCPYADQQGAPPNRQPSDSSTVLPICYRSFPAKRDGSCGSVLSNNREKMNGKHTALFKTARPHPKRFRSHKAWADDGCDSPFD
jgi:hypothetical protein